VELTGLPGSKCVLVDDNVHFLDALADLLGSEGMELVGLVDPGIRGKRPYQ
jgi:hypothetical protein